MFKKLGTLALTAAIALFGLNLPAAQAAATDPVADSLANGSLSFTLPLSSTYTVTTGMTSLSINKIWSLNQTEVRSLGGKTVGLHITVTAPDGTTPTLYGPMQGGTGLSAQWNPNFSFTSPGQTLSPQYGSTSYTLPADMSTFTGGSVQTNVYVSNMALSGNSANPSALPVGTWSLNAKLTIDGADQTETTTWGDPIALSSSSSASAGFDRSLSATAPAGATNMSMNATYCVDSALITNGDVLTMSMTTNGTATTIYPSFSWKVNPQGSNRSGGTGTVVAGDTTNGLVAQNMGSQNVTGGTTYTTAYQVLNQNGANVTGSCKPAAMAKPTLTFANGGFTIGFVGVAGAQPYNYNCYLYDVTAPDTSVATGYSMSSVYPGSNGSCSMGAGTKPGHTYVAKVQGSYYSFTSDLSPASDAVLKPVPGYAFVNPVSGITNQGNKLSRVTNSIAQDPDTTRVVNSSDGANGLFVTELATVSQGYLVKFNVRHVTKSGADSAFAGTGVVAVAIPDTAAATSASTGWYGANHDKWTAAYGMKDMMTMSAGLTLVQGTFGSATTTSFTVPVAKLDAACVSAYGAGYTATNPQMMPSQATPQILTVGANTTTQTINLYCYKMTQGMVTNAPVLVSIADANTVTVLNALVATSSSVNQGTAYFSANPNAGANDAALTIVVIQSLNNMGTTTYDSRVIKTMTPGGVVSTSTATYTVSGAEPGLSLEALNDGTVWGLLQTSTGGQLLKIAPGATSVTQTALTPDTNAAFSTTTFRLPIGLQAGNATALSVVRQTTSPGVQARASIDVSTGNVTTSGEVATTTLIASTSVANTVFINTANNNIYWLINEVASPGYYSLYKWLDPNFHLTAQTITLGNNNPTTLKVGLTGTVSATASSNLPVSYSSADSSLCTVTSAGVVTAVAGSGNCVINVDQSGGDNSVYDSAPQVSITIALAKNSQTITWSNNSPTSLAAGGTATVSATASSNLAVSYSSADTSLCTVNASTGVVTAVASTGDCVIKADQAGNANYDAAPQASRTLGIGKTAQTIAWGNNIPTSVTVNGTVTVSATATSGLAVTFDTTDHAVCTVTSAGVVTAGANAGSCVVTANQAGNATYSAAAQQTKTISVSAAAPAKSAPAVPAVATKLKKGATLKIALSAAGATATKGANANGLPTVVTLATTAKGICSLTAVKTAGKITGYTVKGLAINASKCAVTISITGNDLYNSLTKKVVINVTK